MFNIRSYGHASLRFALGEGSKRRYIYIDPYTKYADYSNKPKADLVVITHDHYDHLDLAAIDLLRTPSTHFIANPDAAAALGSAEVLRNGEQTVWGGIGIEAVPAYNVAHRDPKTNLLYHPKGVGNGYVFTIDGLRIYVAGDTEDIEEMRNLRDITVAYLPKDLPYTMSDDMFIRAATLVNPKFVTPYHYNELDNIARIVATLKEAGINCNPMDDDDDAWDDKEG